MLPIRRKHTRWHTAQFVNGPGGDFHLTQGSPAVDAGQDAAVPAGLTQDIDGLARFLDLPGVGVVLSGVSQKVDIGAFEFQVPRLFLPFIAK